MPPPPKVAGGLPPSYTFSQFTTLDFPEHPEIISDGVLPLTGKFILGAAKGVGKTIYMGQTAVEIASGEPNLGLFDIPEPKRVMIFQKEVQDKDFGDRMEQVARRYGARFNPENLILLRIEDVQDVKLDTMPGRHKLRQFIDRDRPQVVMLDPIYLFHNADEDKAKDVKSLLEYLDSLSFEFNVAFMISHHLKKADLDFRTKRVMHQTMRDFRGSGVWTDWANTVFWMNDQGNNRVLLETFMRNGRTEPPVIVLTKNRDFACFEAEIQDHPTDMLEYELVKVLNTLTGRECKYQDLVDRMQKLKHGPVQTRRAISRLTSKRLAYFIGDSVNGDRLVRLLTPQSKVWVQ